MKESQPGEIRLKNYRIPCYLIDSTRLYFELGEAATLVKSNLQIRLNPDWPRDDPRPLVLDGVDLKLKRLAIDGRELADSEFEVDAEQLTIAEVPKCFELECVTEIRPQDNTSLEGLYKSSAMFCTQCEAEGFRKITYYLDRPDVMSVFTTVISADKARYPVLLSNGNDVDRGETGDGRHWVSWHDPFKKPAYLFALVAGDLFCIADTFTTCSGRSIDLRIFVEAENKDKCSHGMESLQRAMRWDEEVYGREYDLDIFMIVAVNDFNMGAMENKGLNIFNSSCVLANPETATDAAYQRIEGVVAHEYFHNWSGNRVTCRDWFQLSLKEGFTVFRDQEFSADMNSRTVKRIDDVSVLRTLQFAEDAGPMSHPIRPEAYMEIANFYTLTVYEKGAEVIRMLYRLLGPEAFRRGSDLYFERHDGQAVTTEDFIAAMADASGVDLGQFQHWYGQRGTPALTVSDSYDSEEGVYQLRVRQTRPDIDADETQQPLHIPLAMGLISPRGEELIDTVLEITETEQSFVFDNIDERPLPSLLRGFSAPVKLKYNYSRDDLMFLIQHDRDGFNRWDAGQQLAVMTIQDNIRAYQLGEVFSLDERLIAALRGVLANGGQIAALDQAMLARMLEIPSAAYLGEISAVIDVDAIHHARQFVCEEVARQLAPTLLECYRANRDDAEYRPLAPDIARRSLKNSCLAHLMLLREPEYLALCQAQYDNARNMTDRQAAFIALAHSEFAVEKARVLEDFYRAWRHDPLVMDQWFAAQASSPLPDSFEEVKKLLAHPEFSLRNPNKVRSLVGVFCNRNLVNFHREDGAGYEFLADKVLELDELNPQIAARQLAPLTRWRRYTEDRARLMSAQLQRIQARPKLSKDVFEVVTKSLH